MFSKPIGPRIEDIGPVHGPDVPTLCGWCGHGSGGLTYCSRRCEGIVDRIRRFGDSRPLRYRHCRRCGNLFVKTQSAYCSASCARNASRSRHRHRRRTVEKRGEDFTLREVAERDGWRCHLCGKKVPDRPYAARDRDPTIDHLVPVAAGGEHVLSNVALAHNRCNWERSDGGKAQLRLIG